MGQYAFLQVIPREFRDDAEFGADATLSAQYLVSVRELGYTPVAPPVLTWHEIDAGEAARDAAVNGPGVRAGDWRVRAVVEVAEDEPQPGDPSA